MKVEEFERYLTEEELEMFKENLKTEKSYEEYLLKEVDLWNAISGAFVWKKTPQGEKFWRKISQRKRRVR